VAPLDVSNAFGAIPHPALEAAIESCKAGEDFLLAVRVIYTGATSSVSVAGGMPSDIPVRSSINQGCPLSGLLFIMAIDPVVAPLQGKTVNHRSLMTFALLPSALRSSKHPSTRLTTSWT